MKILFIRHAEPDYEHDSLTEKGFREANLLAPYLKEHFPNIKHFYVSAFGRAQRTSEPTKALFPNVEADTCDWLIEFQGKARRLDRENKIYNAWDFLLEEVEKNPELYTERWFDAPILNEDGATVKEEYYKVIKEFDKVLEENGYKRNGLFYDVTNPNNDCIAFFCHFGVAAVMMSHLMNCSPFSLLQNTVLLPSSLTVFVSEERKEGKAHFRANRIGSLSHLDLGKEEESFAARFCELFTDDTRH